MSEVDPIDELILKISKPLHPYLYLIANWINRHIVLSYIITFIICIGLALGFVFGDKL
jgi:hypothetical protein